MALLIVPTPSPKTTGMAIVDWPSASLIDDTRAIRFITAFD
jgi:hypothetical protein